MLKKKMLFWPGRGKSLSVLCDFLAVLKTVYDICVFPFEYDVREVPFHHKSCWYSWIKENKFDWWCGLSLGASLSYAMASLCSENTPTRITLINPFYSREKLSEEKGFSLKNQWNFHLSDCQVNINYFDMVLSVYDRKIPIYHGINILNMTRADIKRIIFVEDSHCIDNQNNQIELAHILLGDNDDEKFNNKFSKHCHVYKQ